MTISTRRRRCRKSTGALVLFLIVLSLMFVHGCAKTGRKKPHPRKKKGSSNTSPPEAYNGSYYGNSNIFDVLSYGAKADGTTDDSKAFLAAWEAACKVESAVVEVPAEFCFLLNPISFTGPCQPNLVFQIDGTIVAPTNSRVWGSGSFQWILFKRLQGITIQGNGLIDGRGTAWWRTSWDDQFSKSKGKTVPKHRRPSKEMPTIKPTALRFYGSYNVTVQTITIQNSPQCHLKFDSCTTVEVSNITISSPGNSPNTDGVHLQNSDDVEIHHSMIGCGDDCISMQTGCSDIRVHNINCGPGHGISIGGLGKDKTKACVSNVTVYDIAIQDALNGVRIKTWQGGSGSVRDVSFSNIQVSNVETPVVIDQFYCDNGRCPNQTSAVAISGITFSEIRGTYAYKAVHLACSDNIPCTGISLSDIELQPVDQVQYPLCWNTYVKSESPTIPPVHCSHSGKPRHKPRPILSNKDRC